LAFIIKKTNTKKYNLSEGLGLVLLLMSEEIAIHRKQGGGMNP